MRTEIYAVTHKDNKVPDGTGCLPVAAGSALTDNYVTPGYLRDDSGDNISGKNAGYCELTALYWIWKNTDADITGLCHYRRFFASAVKRGALMQGSEAEHLLGYYDIIVPRARNYYIETNYSHYANVHHAADLDITRKIIEERWPGYLEAFDRRMAMRSGHRFNMFIMRKPLMDEYCSWLFDILFELEAGLDISGYSGYDRRVFGFVAERLLDVWIDRRGLKAADTDYVFTGREHLAAKALRMTARKLRGVSRGITGRQGKH